MQKICKMMDFIGSLLHFLSLHSKHCCAIVTWLIMILFVPCNKYIFKIRSSKYPPCTLFFTPQGGPLSRPVLVVVGTPVAAACPSPSLRWGPLMPAHSLCTVSMTRTLVCVITFLTGDCQNHASFNCLFGRVR